MSDTLMNSAVASETGSTDHGQQAEHPKPKYDDVNMPVVVLLGILSAILTFVAIAFVQGLYFSWEESMILADWNSRTPTPAEKTIMEQKEIRSGYFETRDGKIFVPVEAAARKMISGKTAETPQASGAAEQSEPEAEVPAEQPATPAEEKPAEEKPAEEKPAERPEPPSPDAKQESEKAASPADNKQEAKSAGQDAAASQAAIDQPDAVKASAAQTGKQE